MLYGLAPQFWKAPKCSALTARDPGRRGGAGSDAGAATRNGMRNGLSATRRRHVPSSTPLVPENAFESYVFPNFVSSFSSSLF